ncbi:MAG: glycosyltransferase [Opitutaceae bacterium]
MSSLQIEELHLIAWALWGYLCLWNVWRYGRQYNKWKINDTKKDAQTTEPSVIVWAPVKGLGKYYEDHLLRLLRQSYSNYSLAVAVESRDDPVYSFISKRFGMVADSNENVTSIALNSETKKAFNLSEGLKGFKIIIAGVAKDEGQKVHNLIAAHKHDDGFGAVIVTVDADALWEPTALKNLVAGLDNKRVGVSMGYRWIIPETKNIPSILASTINSSVSTILGPPLFNSAWAGSMAIKRSTFETLRISDIWKGKVNDESVLSNVLKRHGLRIIFCPGVTPVTLANYSWRSLFNFGRRQYIHQWVYRRILWFYGMLLTTCYVLGWIKCAMMLTGESPILACVCGMSLYLSEITRGILRKQIAQQILPKTAHVHWNKAYFWDTFLTPISFIVHFCIVWSTFMQRRFKWTGIEYEMTDQETRIISSDTH